MFGNGLANGIVEGVGTVGASELWMATLMFGAVGLESLEGLAVSLVECAMIVLKIVVKFGK